MDYRKLFVPKFLHKFDKLIPKHGYCGDAEAGEELSGSQAILVTSHVAVSIGQGQAPFTPPLCQQMVEVRTPGPVVAQITGISVPDAVAPFKIWRELRAMTIALIDAQ